MPHRRSLLRPPSRLSFSRAAKRALLGLHDHAHSKCLGTTLSTIYSENTCRCVVYPWLCGCPFIPPSDRGELKKALHLLPSLCMLSVDVSCLSPHSGCISCLSPPSAQLSRTFTSFSPDAPSRPHHTPTHCHTGLLFGQGGAHEGGQPEAGDRNADSTKPTRKNVGFRGQCPRGCSPSRGAGF